MSGWDAAIIGGGAMGLSTAYALLKRGLRRVVVLERYEVGHDRAASTDNTKAIRYEYGDSAMYARMVGRSIQLWRELEAATRAELYVNCGVVCWGRGEAWHARSSYRTLRELGVPISEVSPQELCRRYPQFAVADMSYATINPEGGFLRASDCLAALASEVRRLGGVIREHCSVVGLSEQGDAVDLLLEGGEQIAASRVALTAGPWSAKLLPQLGLELPLTANKQQVVYIGGLPGDYLPGRFPVFLNLDHDFYGFPLDSRGIFKASLHLPGPLIDPDVPQTPDPGFTEHILTLLRKYIPGAAQGEVKGSRMCMYAMTPDEDFIIDRFVGSDRVVIGAGFSGHGFKFAPLIGELLASLLLEEEPEFPLEPFALARFSVV